MRKGNQVTTHPGDFSYWSWNNSAPNNQAVGNKTATQLCQALGDNWRLPTKDELTTAYNYLKNRDLAVSYRIQYRWSSTELGVPPQVAWSVKWSDNQQSGIGETSQYLVSCVR